MRGGGRGRGGSIDVAAMIADAPVDVCIPSGHSPQLSAQTPCWGQLLSTRLSAFFSYFGIMQTVPFPSFLPSLFLPPFPLSFHLLPLFLVLYSPSLYHFPLRLGSPCLRFFHSLISWSDDSSRLFSSSVCFSVSSLSLIPPFPPLLSSTNLS